MGLAREVATEGIRVNAVRPGIIDTGIHVTGGQPDRVARLGPAIPMQRAGEADEVAAAIAWLSSDEASYCTGAILDVSGGRSLRACTADAGSPERTRCSPTRTAW